MYMQNLIQGGLDMNCKKCGVDVTGMKFCPNCGTKIDKSESTHQNWVALTEKEYIKHYILISCVATIWMFTYTFI